MNEQVGAVLAEIGQSFGDTRLQLCQLEGATQAGNCYVLTGSVLDSQTLTAVLTALGTHFTGVTFDASKVEILRRPVAIRMAVATNLTGLYAGPSFLAEKLSELLNGWGVEVLREQERWCFVRQDDGYLGWIYRPYFVQCSTVYPAPTHIVCEPMSLLRSAPSPNTAIVTRIPGGTKISARGSDSDWLNLELAGIREGWMPAGDLRSLLAFPADEAGRRAQIAADAFRFVGVPYLWGGCTVFGIDCSGFARLLHHLSGLSLPRDADMQFNAGKPADFPYQPGDLLFFGDHGCSSPPKITHVAVSLGDWSIIHSSRSRNGVYVDDVEAVTHLRESFVAAKTFVSK